MLCKIESNPMHLFCGVLRVPFVPVRVTRGALVAHLYSYAPPRCRTSQYPRTFIPQSVSLSNDLGDSVFFGVGLVGFKTRVYASLLACAALSLVFQYFVFLFLPSVGWLCGAGVFGLMGASTLSQPYNAYFHYL